MVESTVTVGLDVHARSIRLAAVRADELLEERTLPYDEEAVERLLRRWPVVRCCYERDRPPPKREPNDSKRCRLNSWITLRTCDSSVSSMRAISGALISVFEASRISARCLVEASFDCFESRFSRCPSCGASSRTNTWGDASTPSSGRMRPERRGAAWPSVES